MVMAHVAYIVLLSLFVCGVVPVHTTAPNPLPLSAARCRLDVRVDRRPDPVSSDVCPLPRRSRPIASCVAVEALFSREPPAVVWRIESPGNHLVHGYSHSACAARGVASGAPVL